MAMQNREGVLNRDDQNWLTFFALASWFILSLLFLSDAPRKILHAMSKAGDLEKASVSKFQVEMIENPDRQKKKEKKHRVYKSTEENQARGQLTRNRGFEAVGDQNKLAFAKKGMLQSRRLFESMRTTRDGYLKKNKVDFQVRIFKEKHRTRQKGHGGNLEFGNQPKTIIPTHYRFRDRFAFSFDRNGEPRVPTAKFKHYTYYKKMIDKIRDNFAPPGGTPMPIYDDSYHRMMPTPGSMTYSTFPSQNVRVVFALDENGDVIELRLWQSLGYKSLDAACIESIERARNFGPPPDELVEDGKLVIPFIFQIITR